MRVGTALLVIAVGALLLGAALFRTWPILNVVRTGETPEYPDIQPRTYRATVERVYDATVQAVRRLPRWSLVSTRPESREVRAEARSRIFRFVDDVRIQVVSRDGTTLVEVTSSSRVGRGDFGQNARNIRTFFRALDEEMHGKLE